MRNATRPAPEGQALQFEQSKSPAERLLVAYNQDFRRLPEAGRIGNEQFFNALVGSQDEFIRIFGVRRDDRSLLVANGDFGQQPRVGDGKAVEVGRLADGQRTADKALLVDDLGIAQLLLRADDVVDRIELVLEFDLLGAEVFDLALLFGDLFGKIFDLNTHLSEVFAQLSDFGSLVGELLVQVADHLLEPVDPQIGLAQLGGGTLQRSDLRLVLLEQAVDGRDIVVDLLDGTADAFGIPGDGDQVFTRLDHGKILRDGVDIGEDGIDQ